MRKLEALGILKNLITKAYAPYSNFKVAAVVEGENGEFAGGVNVENASYGLTVCAERIATFNYISNGFKNPKKVYLYCDSEDFVTPCGACRQVLSEFNPEMEITVFNNKDDFKTFKLNELLPERFGKENLKG